MVQIGKALTDRTLDPPLRALVVYNSNPATIAPNQNLVLEGLRREDLLTVVVEQQLTDTARHADYVFPATTQLEHLDLFTSWGQEYLSLNLPALPPRGEARTNTDFFRGLSRRMGYTEPYLYESDEEMVKGLLDSRHPYLGGVTYDAAARARLRPPRAARAVAAVRRRRLHRRPPGSASSTRRRWPPRGSTPCPRTCPCPPRSRPTKGRRYPLALLTSKSTRHFNNSSHAGEARPAQGRGRAAPADARQRRRGAQASRTETRARLQPPRLDDAARPSEGRHASGRRVAPAGLLGQPAAGRLVGQRPHPGRPQRPGRRGRLPRRAGRGRAVVASAARSHRPRRVEPPVLYRITRTLNLTAGRRLGTYEILSALGAGGMGEVYRATDTRLGRDVALKILPEAFASDADRLARFEREAKVLASLNHPNVAHLYGLETRPRAARPTSSSWSSSRARTSPSG